VNPALLAFTAGSLVTLAAVLLVARRLPVQPRINDVLARLDVHHIPTRNRGPRRGPLRTRIGQALADSAPGIPGFATPTRDLDLLDIPAADFYARKAILALTGLLAPAVLTAVMTTVLGTVIVLPLLAAPLVALVCWLQPDVQIRTAAAARRREFTRFVTTYLELVAVALLGTTTADAALTTAATVSDSWVFTRIRTEYRIAEATRTTKWEALETLADTVGVAALGEMARIMRLSEAHMPIRDQLRAACDKLRAQTVTDDALTAERTSNRMQAPIFATILPVLALVLIPTALQLTQP
jgi:hypothetical protein